MNYTEFKNRLDDGEVFSVYLFEGEDSFFRERGLKLLKSKFVENPELNLVCFDGEPLIGELTASLNGYPFMSNKRMTVIKEFYPKQEYFKSGLKGYLENPSDCSILVVLNEKPCEALKKFSAVAVVDCGKADTALLIKWIKAECGKVGITISGETAKLLSEYCSSDMTRIETETNKLISFVGDGGTITSEVVDEMVARDIEYKIYELTDCIGKKKFDKAFSIIADMMAKNEPPQKILVSVYNYFRKLLLSAISDKTSAELAKLFGIKETAASITKKQAAMFKKRSLKSAVDLLTDYDYKIKSGQADADNAMWVSVFKIMTDN